MADKAQDTKDVETCGDVETTRRIDHTKQLAHAIDRLMIDVAKAECPGECKDCGLNWSKTFVYVRPNGMIDTTACMALIASRIIVPGFPRSREERNDVES